MLKPTVFREYDIRGVADIDLHDEGVRLLGQALGTYIQRAKGPRINVGRDCRLSSPRLRNALVAGLKESGAQVFDLGVVPTPVLYHSAVKMQADGAIMITGSHNPSDYNGFKTVCGTGTIYGDAIQQLRRMIESGDLATGKGTETSVDAVTSYIDDIASRFQFERRVKVAVDGGNGTAGPVFGQILDRLNVEATRLYFDMDGNFPNHHPDPTMPENLKHLAEAVDQNQCELGIAFDGDSDRIGAIDENGNVVYGDQLMLIYGREILTRKPGAVFIGEVKCSQQMYDDLRKRGGKPIMWKTGHSLIKAKMKQEHAELAGEMSGHMFFADRYYGYDDALYAACRLLEIVSQSGQPLSAQIADLPKLHNTPEIRVDCPDETKFDVVANVIAEFRGKYEIVDVDGMRVIFPEGWGLVRASNTQPILVLRFEASNPEKLAEYRKLVEAAVERAQAKVAAAAVPGR
jgi:phosphomannomutase/phosphoglucomutase